MLTLLSILNVFSIAIRTDWNYEHEADLVSYDLAIWPWIEPRQRGDITLYLTSLGETVDWNKLSEVENCNSYGMLNGLVTSVCDCENNYVNYAERTLKIPWDNVNVTVIACSKHSGGDGVIGKFNFGNFSDELFIPGNTCVEKSFNLRINTSERYVITLKPKIYGKCEDEEIVWKKILIQEVIK